MQNDDCHKMKKNKYAIWLSAAIMTGLFSPWSKSQTIELSQLGEGVPGVLINNTEETFEFGGAVSSAGDWNNDGFDDVIIGAYGANQSYIIFGASDISGVFALSEFGKTINGVLVNGGTGFSNVGANVSNAGDFNQDGIDDILIGSANTASIIFGSNTIDSIINISDVGTSVPGLLIIDATNQTGQQFDINVGFAGDVNNDGGDDIIIGIPGADADTVTDVGQTLILFGSNTLMGVLSTDQIGNTIPGAVLKGINMDDLSGVSVDSAGDVNNDGVDDVVIGANLADTSTVNGINSGQAYVVFGGNQLNGALSLSDIGGSLPGLIMNGVANGDNTGFSVAGTGDINNDAIDDVIVGSAFAGQSYLVFGNNQLNGTIELSDLDSNQTGVIFNGVGSAINPGHAGFSVSTAGDINGDGTADVLIGVPDLFQAPPSNGESFVIFGDSSLNGSVELSEVGSSITGRRFIGATQQDNTGFSVNTAGDFNGDGVDDIIIGAPSFIFDSQAEENVYIVFGNDMFFSDGFESN